MKGLVVLIFVILAASLIGCARTSAHADTGLQPVVAPRAVILTVTPTPTLTSTPFPTATATATATATEAASATSTLSPTPANTAMPTSTPSSEPTVVPTVAPVATTAPSEYFPKISLGKLPPGPKAEKWWETITPATSIDEKEEICISLNNAKEFENVSYGIYNADKQEYAKPKTIFSPNGKIMRGSSSCLGKITFSGKGQYEFRVWIGDDLATSLPFEVTFDAPTPTPRPAATKAPQSAVVSPPPPPDPILPLKVPSTGFALPVSSMNKEAEVEPGIANYVKAIYAYRIQPEEPNLIISMRIYNLLSKDISGITIQWCITNENENYSYCSNPKSSTFSAGDPIRSILIDTNHSANFRDEIAKYGMTGWDVNVKILAIVLKATK